MNQKCQKINITKNDFKNCLINSNLNVPKSGNDNNEIIDGYIEIGEYKILKNPTKKSIKVYIYHQWAVDMDGTMYLMGQLG